MMAVAPAADGAAAMVVAPAITVVLIIVAAAWVVEQITVPPPPMNNRWRPGLRYWGGDPWIDNWQSYRGLYAPPYGYRWVQAGDQFLLTAIATGIISAVVAGSVMNGGPR